MDTHEYHRLMSEGYRLAFEENDAVEGAKRYASALALLAPGALGDSLRHGEYAAVLYRLGRLDECLAEGRRAVEAAEMESDHDAGSSVVAMARYFLGQHLVEAGKATEALEVVTPSLVTRSKFAASLMAVKAEALEALGQHNDARLAAREAESLAGEKQRPRIRERLVFLLEG